jgi:hypothetical protein
MRLLFVPLLGSLTLGFFLCGQARADEGMWTFDDFPSQKVAGAYGFSPDQAWLDHVRLASVRLAFGCSGSFISPNGLVMTNHHCAQACITALSTGGKDYNRDGFYAPALNDEKKCPALEVNQLIKIDDVTERVQKAERGLPDAQANAARKAEIARITGACDKTLRCDVVALYSGGQYKLYTYRPFRNVHLVWAPEFAIAFFGGDPDNFTFPRYDLDITLLRIYDGTKPLSTPEYFKWNPAGAAGGELTFVSGNPGRTDRLDTVAQFAYMRDVQLPFQLHNLSDFDGYITRYAAESDEHHKQALDDVFGYENTIKLFIGQDQALLNPSFFPAKQKQEAAFRSAIALDPSNEAKYGSAWDNIAKVEQLAAERSVSDSFRDGGFTQFSQLLFFARTLVRGTAELAKPSDQRLPEYSDARLRTLEVRLFSEAPVYPEYERAKLAWYFTKFRQYLTVDDPLVQQVLGKESPEELAALIATSKLTDPALRRALWNGGPAAVNASSDPAIVLMRKVEPEALAVRKFEDDNVEAPLRANSELIGLASFVVHGTQLYPDATFTARLSYGSVKGYEQNGATVEPFTNIGGLYERTTGRDPFKLPTSWVVAQAALDPRTPLDFVTTNDIIGGNSGSPVIDRDARIIGLIFDGNLQFLSADFGFEGLAGRAVAVDSAALTAALKTVYHADRIVEELGIQ